jgi:hypothetical protein
MVTTSFYADVESMLLKHGERLFPFCCFDEPRDWEGIYRAWRVIIAASDRFMTPDEILSLYE